MQHKQVKIQNLKEAKAKALIEAGEAGALPKEEEEEETTLETLILQIISMSHEMELEPITYINLLTLIRKVIPNDKIISEKQFLIDEIVEIAKDKVVIFDKKLSNFLKAQQPSQILASDSLQIQHFEETMLSSFAETMMTCAMYIN